MEFFKQYLTMPFGPQILNNGSILFRLWGPEAKKVELFLPELHPPCYMPLTEESDGWYQITTDLAHVGSKYQFRINGNILIPDPASKFQPEGVHGPSQVMDSDKWEWHDESWNGVSWENAIVYELHVGTFSEEGTYAGIKNKLDYFVDLGITALQFMPIAEFSGRRNWGYDCVLLFAPKSIYGTTEELKDLIDCAHQKGIMVLNDVVYNHFGPDGNYLNVYAPQFFQHNVSTPWGKAVNFDGTDSYWVRQFFIQNALFWLREYHFDGLRFDAVHSIFDKSKPHILEHLAETVRRTFNNDRNIHLVLENDDNASHYLKRNSYHPQRYFDAQWNDDFHHSMHVILTNEETSYYQDYKDRPIRHLGRCLTEGFSYQGEKSCYRKGQSRGENSKNLSLLSFITFLQNHDQIGNRIDRTRISRLCSIKKLELATAILLLSPSPPLLFMGQEWASNSPFTYFVDFSEHLGGLVAEGRHQEFVKQLIDENLDQLKNVPLPNELNTYLSAKLDWHIKDQDLHLFWFGFHKKLIQIRHHQILPLLSLITKGRHQFQVIGDSVLSVRWLFKDGRILKMIANLNDNPTRLDDSFDGEIIFTNNDLEEFNRKQLNPWTVVFLLEDFANIH